MALIKKLWNVACIQWKNGNVVLHVELGEELQAREVSLNMELTHEYNSGSVDVPPMDINLIWI